MNISCIRISLYLHGDFSWAQFLSCDIPSGHFAFPKLLAFMVPSCVGETHLRQVRKLRQGRAPELAVAGVLSFPCDRGIGSCGTVPVLLPEEKGQGTAIPFSFQRHMPLKWVFSGSPGTWAGLHPCRAGVAPFLLRKLRGSVVPAFQ